MALACVVLVILILRPSWQIPGCWLEGSMAALMEMCLLLVISLLR